MDEIRQVREKQKVDLEAELMVSGFSKNVLSRSFRDDDNFLSLLNFLKRSPWA